MVSTNASFHETLDRITARRNRLKAVLARARTLFESGATGVQVGAALTDGLDAFLVELLNEHQLQFDPTLQNVLSEHTAVIAVGGSGRGDLAPYSDVDLLLLYVNPARGVFPEFSSGFVRDCWDAGLKLGHSVRTLADTVTMGRTEPQFATSLVETRLIWGSEELYDRFRRVVCRKVIAGRAAAFVHDCVQGRTEEHRQHGATVNELEPDVKRSLGGLRDVQLVRWIGFAHYGTADIPSLRLRGALTMDDARQLVESHEFLMRIRADLHFQAGRPQDVLIRDEQLRIARKRGIEGTAGMRPVERLMQTYFRHSKAIAEIAQRFTRIHQHTPVVERLFSPFVTHRFDRIYRYGPKGVDVVGRHRDFVCSRLETILKAFLSAALYGTDLAPGLVESIKRNVPNIEPVVSEESARMFRRFMRTHSRLGRLLRVMYDTGVLEILIPDFARVRGLLQFNQYHSYTVDEHTFRAIEIIERFDQQSGPVGAAYRDVRHKATLHLALLLHDVGKGLEGDHSVIGAEIAERIGRRLHLTESKHEMLVFLVRHHLDMAHLAFRRNFSDPSILLPFARDVGSAEILRMLYALTAADVTAVGPEVWTDWKGELLAALADRTSLVLSGQHYRHQEEQLLRHVKDHVLASIAPLEERSAGEWHKWVEQQLGNLPPHYLTGVSPSQIAADLDALQQLQRGEIIVDGIYDAETDTVDYRILIEGPAAAGCFHKMVGALTANRLEIVDAQINTSLEGVVIDRFRVVDRDFAGETPQHRIDEVCNSIRGVLAGQLSVIDLFQRYQRFGTVAAVTPISGQKSRVVIDNDSTNRATIIDVFAHDRPGLLYMLARTLYDLGLSVMLAKIGTHVDQVVDVFYVSEQSGRKIVDELRLDEIRGKLIENLAEFESQGSLQFAS